jgi:hypothetical protein
MSFDLSSFSVPRPGERATQKENGPAASADEPFYASRVKYSTSRRLFTRNLGGGTVVETDAGAQARKMTAAPAAISAKPRR